MLPSSFRPSLLPAPAWRAARHPARVGQALLTLLLGVVALSVASRLAVPLFGAVVPFTWQPQVVMLLAHRLGRRGALAAIATWLGLAAMGAPCLAAGGGLAALFGPSLGYLASYALVVPLTARVCAWPLAWRLPAWLAIASVPLVVGSAWLSVLAQSAQVGFTAGLLPFWLADGYKTVAACLVGGSVRARWPGRQS